MTLNGVIALILRFSPNSIALLANYVTVVEDRPTVWVKKVAPPLKLFAIFLFVVNLCKWKLPLLLHKHIPSFTPILVHSSEYLYEL